MSSLTTKLATCCSTAFLVAMFRMFSCDFYFCSVLSSLQIDLALDDSEKNQLTKDSFRWDQRLFSIILKMSGVGKGSSRLLPGERALTNLCDSTGG